MTTDNKNNKLIYLSGLIALILSDLAYADTEVNPKIDKTSQDTMIVTMVEQSAPLMVITDPKKPRQPVPASDGADYLKTISGFSLVRKGGSNGDPVFRGMFGSRLNILTNGGTILGGCGGRMDTPTSYISPETYDRITMIKGPETVIWGPMGSTATILFERDILRFSKTDSFMRGDLLAGTNSRFDQSFDGAFGNEDGYIRLIGNHAKANDYHDGNNDRVHSKWSRWNSDIALGFTPNKDTALEVTAGKGNGKASYADRGMDGSRFLRESLGMRFEQANIAELLAKLEGQLYYNYINHMMDNYHLRPVRMRKMESNPSRKTVGGRINTTWQSSDIFKLQLGIDGRQDTHKSKTRRNMLTTHNWQKDSKITNYGLFSELNLYLTDVDTIISGMRVDRYSADATQLNQSRHKVLPGGFMRYEHDLTDYVATVYTGLGYTSRFPDYWELFSASNKVQMFKKLNPEKTTQLDAGIIYKTDTLNVQLSSYVGWVNDYILYTTLGKSNNVNNVDARTLGSELNVNYHITTNIMTDMALNYSWAKNRDNHKPLPQIPPLELKLGLHYHADNWSIGSLWRLVNSQHRIAKDQGNVIGKDFASSKGFGIFSLNGEYSITKQFRLSAGVDNLFNKYYVEHLNRGGVATFGYTANQQIAEPGRVVWAKLHYDF